MQGVYARPKRYCSAKGCDRIHYGRGFCHNHYKKDEAVRYGHPYLFENRIDVLDDYAVVYLEDRKRRVNGKVFIDLDDVDMIRSFKWCLSDGGYGITNLDGTMIRMHAMIMGGIGIDHIDGNRLNNRKSNLRKASYLQNNRHRTSYRNRHGFKGVISKGSRFVSRIKYEGTVIYCGSYLTAEEAANGYDQYAIQLFGDFAHTNFEY